MSFLQGFVMLVLCNVCNGRKVLMPLGGIEKKCDKCCGTGRYDNTEERKLEGIPTLDKMLVEHIRKVAKPKGKPGRKPGQIYKKKSETDTI